MDITVWCLGVAVVLFSFNISANEIGFVVVLTILLLIKQARFHFGDGVLAIFVIVEDAFFFLIARI
ncbi:hypothetical protein DERF_002704 [Dermatophagoides farinae]|uniref:Uncharacterized protein n=1 Tax=Dermatophagoides farinae TaxID=6954 RepID=A0A922LDD8_DERFA|nr:hypothetical protein DERF_002704 [Dermatophagoides farinae]